MRFWTVDVFAPKPFSGNSASVFLLENQLDTSVMQHLAMEMNTPATIFFEVNHDRHFIVRYFSPKVERNVCGHAAMAAAHILWEEGFVSRHETLYLESKSGILKAFQTENRVSADFPAVSVTSTSTPEGLVDALNITPVFVGKAEDVCLVELPKVKDVINLSPNIRLLLNLPFRSVIVTASDAKLEHFDFVSRYFSPKTGVIEDPATASAHAKLAPYWAKHLQKTSFKAYQASQRGGWIDINYIGGDFVTVTGDTHTVCKGEISLLLLEKLTSYAPIPYEQPCENAFIF